VRVRILGPLEASHDGRELELGAGRQRALLALLLLHAHEVVSADRLIEDLWSERAPASAAKVVQGYVSQLRRVLPPETIVTRGSGYVLQGVDTDAGEFERLLDEARRQGPQDAGRTLRTALALWRGRPLADVEYETWAQAEIARLEELRLVALEERIENDLRLGADARLVPELEGLIAEHPLRERICAQLMLALYRAGRQADALDAYANARRRLVEELGIEPGPELQDLQRRILEQDRELGPPPRPLARVAQRAPWLIAGGAALIAGAAAATVLLFTGGTPGVGANALVLLDGHTGKVDAQIGVGSRPSQIAVGAGAVWVLNSDDNTVSEIDPGRRKAVATFAAGPRPVALAAGAGGLWIANAPASNGSQVEGTMLPASLTELDPTARTPVRTVPLLTKTVGSAYTRFPGDNKIVVGGGSIWAIAGDFHLLRLDARTGRLVRRFPFGADSLAFGGGELWIVQAGQQVLRLDPRTDHVDFTYPLGAGPGIAWGFGSAWVADPVQGLLWRISPGPGFGVRSIPVAQGASAIAVAGGAVWASSTLADEVVRVDPTTNRANVVVRLTAPEDLAPGPNGVWVTTGAPPPASGPLPPTSCGPLVYPGPGKPQFIVASDLPFKGPVGVSTRPIQRGIEELIREPGFRAGRFTLGYQSCDDSTVQAGSFDWAKCIANARAYSSDLEVIGVVGTYNSGCSNIEIPITDGAHGGPLAMVSPLNTVGGLTIPSVANLPGFNLYPRAERNFARVIAADQIQYAADAVLEKRLGVRRVAVLDDGGVWAVQADRWFSYSARKLGLHTVRIPWSVLHAASARILARVRASQADGVFVAAGGLPEGGPVVAALRAGLPQQMPIVVTDWFGGYPSFVKAAGGSVDGVYASNPGAPDAWLPGGGRRFAARVGSPLSYTAAYGGGAAEVLLDAIARSDGTRASVARELFKTRIHGILGPITINGHGDPTTAPVTIFRIRKGARNDTGVVDNQDAVVYRVIVPPPRIIPYSS
jgi:DNA-binding SARP family transcriptional activator/ABC-type branched-subunit amino acid transport system substrate-binding protein/streptogramin lyase